jgi:hypothetical protein
MSDTPVFDESELEVNRSEDKLKKLAAMAASAFDYDIKIAELSAKISELTASKNQLINKDIPELMHEVDIKVVGVPGTNFRCELLPYYHANIAADWEPERKKAAFDWLEAEGHGDLIKNSLRVDFNREDSEKAKQIYDRLNQMMAEYELEAQPELIKGVHFQTLTAFVKEQITQNENIPLAVLGATVGEVVKFKENKNGKSKKK